MNTENRKKQFTVVNRKSKHRRILIRINELVRDVGSLLQLSKALDAYCAQLLIPPAQRPKYMRMLEEYYQLANHGNMRSLTLLE